MHTIASTRADFKSSRSNSPITFGPRWHFYLGDIITAIPVPWKFAKGDFESGLAAKVLRGH
jgi:hypothetical protein